MGRLRLLAAGFAPFIVAVPNIEQTVRERLRAMIAHNPYLASVDRMVERGRADREPKRSRCLSSRTVQVRQDTTELRAGEPRTSCRDLRLYQRGRRKRVRRRCPL